MNTAFRLLTLLGLCALASCDRTHADRTPAEGSPNAAAPAPGSAPPPLGARTSVATQIQRGKRWVEHFECARCHEGTDTPAPRPGKRCVGCHQSILAGTFEYRDPHSGETKTPTKATLEEWQRHIVHLRQVPTLSDLGRTLRADWLKRFLLAPDDLRPALPASMPKLPLSDEQAEDIAAYLTRDAPQPKPKSGPAKGDVASGAQIYASKGCGTCHAFAARVPQLPADPRLLASDALLAPDLRFTRDRFRAEMLDGWLTDPKRLRKGALMPKPSLSPEERTDVAAFILHSPLNAPEARPLPSLLPLLKRPVRFDEVNQAVFRKVCWHCHAQPDFAMGDGGPGMSGGFGFKPRKLDLSEYSAILGGYLDDRGERRSVFTLAQKFPHDNASRPMLVAVLIARQREEHGLEAPVRGMPLGLPALSPQQIQLVASWIDQGRPR